MIAATGAYAGLVSTALFAILVFALPIALLAALTYRRLRSRIARIEPAARATILSGMAALPFIGALAGLLASFLPSLLSWVGVVADHCHLHPDHIHLCLQHPPQLAHTFFASMFVASVLLACGALVSSAILHFMNARRLVGQLLQMSEYDRVRGLHIVDTDAPLAFAAGLRSPRLFLSSGLVARLSATQLAAVIAHERAHARRHDALIHTVASALAYLHFPATRKLLLGDLALAAEQACDEAACEVTGDRLVVAEAILAVEKMFVPRKGPELRAAVHFNGSNVGERVIALLNAQQLERPSSRVFWTAASCALVGLALLGDPLHHATESLLGLIFH